LTPAGGVLCWGDNTYGQLGNGSTVSTSTPVPVSGLESGVMWLSVGSYHACAVTTAGETVCWGENNVGQLGDGTTKNSSTPVAVSSLRSNVTSVSAGYGHTCAVTTAGGVLCWGDDTYGQLGDGATRGQTVPVGVTNLTAGIASVSAGFAHTCAVSTKGAAMCWGLNNAGQLGTGTTTDKTPNPTPQAVSDLSTGVLSISAGYAHTCAVTTAGSALCWGLNAAGQLGSMPTNATVPSQVAGLAHVASISAGYLHTCAVTQSGGALCWGFNGKGQLGSGSKKEASAKPMRVSGLDSGVVSISAAEVGDDLNNNGMHTCAITAAGGAECWGNNAEGALGEGTTANKDKPVMVSNYRH
jgi:alpha-tubulin suppressor-like RCC1 family protein